MQNVFSFSIPSLLFLFGQFVTICGDCYDSTAQRKAITCLTFPKNAALNRRVTASNTCGTPPAGYCVIGPERTCRICNSSSPVNRHPVEFTVDVHNPFSSTWWQSQTWWETNQIGLSQLFEPLRVNITVSLLKEYLISGGVYVTFQAERPKQMIIERSVDFGITWKPYQFFATNCTSAFNMEADPPITPQNRFQATCTQRNSGQYPTTGGNVVFDPRKRYLVSEYYNDEVRLYLSATDIRLSLLYPGTDGREYLNTEATLNQYYYAISDFKVDARCNCNGHAEFCDVKQNSEACECKHYTTGRNCETCLPLYNAKPWRAGNATDANECQECQCYKHATSCIYNSTLGYGVCQNCQHNTRGHRCEICAERFYRDFNKPLADVNVCQPCNCYLPGIRDDGKCLQVVTSPSALLGQCNCKTGVFGRRCDQCVPGRWGFTAPPEGTCFECGCNRFGVLNANITCNQYTGQCYCKPNTEGRTCNLCKDGYHTFPTQLGADCRKCDCDPGGSLSPCDKVTGKCNCRNGITGIRCDTPMTGFFFPNFTYIIIEPDLLIKQGQFRWYWSKKDFGRYFSGFSRIRLSAGQEISVQFQVPVTFNFFMVFRYSLFPPSWYRRILLYGAENIAWTGASNISSYLSTTDNARFWQIRITVANLTGAVVRTTSVSMANLFVGEAWAVMDSSSFKLSTGQTYTITFTYSSLSVNFGTPWDLVLDSIILTPDLSFVSYFSTSSVVVQRAIRSCQSLSLSLKTMPIMEASCRGYTFSVDAIIYGRMISCGCYVAGSLSPVNCEPYGGQCQCKPGFGGRTCYHCLPGYFMASNGLCTECGCSQAGSITPVCNQTTSVCLCKRNTQGTKCNQCKPNSFDLSASNPDGCQECFGFGHLRSCRSAVGFALTLISTNFTMQGRTQWSLFTAGYQNITSRLNRVPSGVQYLDQSGEISFFVAPNSYLGNKLSYYGQRLIIQMTLMSTRLQRQSLSWHVRFIGNNQTVLFNLQPMPSMTQILYTTRLHEDFSNNYTTLSSFAMKAILGQLTAFHIFTNFYLEPQTIILHYVAIEWAERRTLQSGIRYINYVENATCLAGYEGLSCERCILGYTRAIPFGGPLVNCVPCNCNNRSKICDQQSGICSNCQPGTLGNHCERCIPNVLPPLCNQCIPGFWGLSLTSGCKPCNCYLPGTINGNNNICDVNTGQCQCNSTMNVGGRQCNKCKENSYNISLGELQCKECPPCYGLIEKEVLELHHGLTTLKADITKIMADPSFNVPIPLYQRLTTTNSLVAGIVAKATSSLATVTRLDSLWRALDASITTFSATVLGSTTTSYRTATNVTLTIQLHYNRTVSSLYNARALIVNGFLLLNVSSRSRIDQQNIALRQLQTLRDEIQRYLQASRQRATFISNEANTIKSQVDTSVQRALTSTTLSQKYRTDATSLGLMLRILDNSIRETVAENEKLRRYALEWLANSTRVFGYANTTNLEVTRSTVDYTREIRDLNQRTTLLSATVSSQGGDITNILRNNNAAAQQISILKQQNTALDDNVKTRQTRADDMYTKTLAAEQKAVAATRSALATEAEALSILNILVNFSTVASQAALDAQSALVQVDVVLRDTSKTIADAQSIKSQLAPIKVTVSSSASLMREGNRIIMQELQTVTSLYTPAKSLELVAGTYVTRISAINAQQYITVSVTPRLQACDNFRVSSTQALSAANSALVSARGVKSQASSISQDTLRLGTLITSLPIIDQNLLTQTQTSVQKLVTDFQALNVTNSLSSLRLIVTNQTQNIASFKTQIRAMSVQIIHYKQMLQSLNNLTC